MIAVERLTIIQLTKHSGSTILNTISSPAAMVTVPLLCRLSSGHEKLFALEERGRQPLEMLANKLHET